MSDLEFYTLRWRGRESGPFALSEINRHSTSTKSA